MMETKIGSKIGELTIIKPLSDQELIDLKRRTPAFYCKCSCGRIIIRTKESLRRGRSLLCNMCIGMRRRSSNTYRFCKDYVIIYDKFKNKAYIDKEDFDAVKDKYFYLYGNRYFISTGEKPILLERCIANKYTKLAEGEYVNFKNKDKTTDCRKVNLIFLSQTK